MRFRKKPVVIEAHQTPAINQLAEKFLTWAEDVGLDTDFQPEGPRPGTERGCFYIQTLEGVMLARPSDYVIKGVNGEFYPCKPDIFEKTYEPVEVG